LLFLAEVPLLVAVPFLAQLRVVSEVEELCEDYSQGQPGRYWGCLLLVHRIAEKDHL
jgi:hypothetical protein